MGGVGVRGWSDGWSGCEAVERAVEGGVGECL